MLNWPGTEETSIVVLSFTSRLRDAVASCPKLFFISPDAPVTLCTDASDYGVGAYLFQTIDEVEQPIAFLSKSLSKSQFKWSTIEKECYSIFWAINKLDYLLRDIRFLLLTDHANLTYVNSNPEQKVQRWKLSIQQYNFDMLYFEGYKNNVADDLSRINITDDVTEEELQMLFPMLDAERVIIPQDKYKLLGKIHNSIVGHVGVEKAISKLNALKQEWPDRLLHVKQFIKQCPCCQKMNPFKTPIITHPFTLASYGIMDRINVDTIGPLPPDVDGNEYILAVIDCFSRFLELYAIKDTTALAATNSLVNFTGRYGVPAEILTDNGTQYANKVMEELHKIYQNEHKFTNPYSHEENGIIERANKEILRHLRAIIYDTRIVDKWSNYLPLVQRIMNSQVHESIGVSPASILFGNSLTLDRGILFPYQPNESVKLSEWTSNLLEAQEIIISTAIATQNKTDMFHIAKHSGKGPITEFPINSYVLVKYENDQHRPPTKFHTKLRGPLRVVNKMGAIYTCENLVTNKLEDFHIKLLTPFLYDPAITSPNEVAYRDNQHFIVTEILAHRFNKRGDNKSSDLTFLTKWGDDTQSWEPFHNLRSNRELHKYLKAHKLQRYIPKQFKTHPLTMLTDNR